MVRRTTKLYVMNDDILIPKKAARRIPRRFKTVSTKKTVQRKKKEQQQKAEKVEIVLRPHQVDALNAFDAGKRRQMNIWHRRAGKDFFGMQLARREIINNPANYWHMFPKHAQARRAIWTGMDSRLNAKFIELAFGGLYSKKPNDTDMFIQMDNGATWQLLGSDNYNRHLGSNPLGVIFSEWALCDPKSWNYIKPILKENGGWAIFITTYRGRNHAYQMAQELKDNDKWYVDIRTVNDTVRNDGLPIISESDIQDERDEGMSEAIIQQEYYCNPVAIIEGAIYGSPMIYLERTNRIAQLGYDPMRPAWCIWSFKHYPICISCMVVQPDITGGSDILYANNFYFQDTTEVFSAFTSSNKYPIAKHVLYGAEDAQDIIEQATCFGFSPDLVFDLEEIALISKTSLWLRMSRIDANQNVLLDSLRGFKIASSMIEDDFNSDESMEYLVNCCEAASMYQESSKWSKQQWHRGRSYRASDRMVI